MGLIWSGPARRDLFEIAAYYEPRDPDAADEMLDRIKVAPTALLDFPEMGAPTHRRGIRKWLVRGTPFLLFYAIVEDRIEVRRVRHGATNWREQI